MQKTQLIISDLYEALVNSIGADIGERIFENQATDNTTLPCLTFQIISNIPDYLFSEEKENVHIQLNMYGAKQIGVNILRSINDTLINDLNRKSLEHGIIKILNKGEVSITENIIWIMSEIIILA